MTLNFEIKTEGEGFKGTAEELQRAILQAATIISQYCASDCRDELENPPRRVDTGRLKNSINGYVDGGDTVVVGTNVEYAIYVHEGTRFMAANRFLRNGIQNNIEEYKSVIEKCMKG